MDWDDIRYFLALARVGSVRTAGAALGVSHSTVARRVESLEARLAARLFDRNRDGYFLTEAGRRMLPGAERIEREMSALERGLIGQDDRLAGSVTVTCFDTYVARLVMRELNGLCREHPEVELSVTTDIRPFDLTRREADVAIRVLGIGAQPPEFLIGVELAPVTMASYVATRHEARLDPEHEGSTPRWVGFQTRAPQSSWVAQSSYPQVPIWGAFSTLELLVQAAHEGLGLVMLPTYVGDREPGLRRLARPDLRHAADLWLLSHPDLRDNARFRATRSAIARAFEEHGALFRGEGWCAGAPGRPEITPSAPGSPNVRCTTRT
jgi:DNA-binding transcriptional LysR family regulator